MIDILKGQREPIEFATLCERAGEKYSQDVIAGVQALELFDKVLAYHEFRDGSERSKLWVAWNQEDEEAPAVA
jgi:hypothetical protein